MGEFNPTWKAAENGFPANREAINNSTQLNQLLSAHGITVVYPGNAILTGNPTGNGQHLNLTSAPPNYRDRSQPFVMPASKTAIGRVTFPVQYTGNGSDLQVTLCPDASGSPNLTAPIVSTVVPASWITNLTTTGSLTTDVPPLVTSQFNAISLQNDYSFAWSQPAIGPGGAAQYATPTVSDSWMILSGGYTGSAAATTVATIQSLGGGFIGNPMLQPSLPQAVYYHMMCATENIVMVAGGTNGTAFYSNVWTANWSSDTGVIGAWTAQASLPNNIIQGCAASWGNYVYVTGGNADLTPASAYTNVYYANASNGQIQSWTSTTPMPVGLQVHFAAAINGWLVVCGGQNSSGTTQNGTYYAKINSDGSLGMWHTGPTMPVGVYALGAQWSFSFTEDAMIVWSGLVSSGTYTSQMQTLPVMTTGVGNWWSQQTSQASDATGAFQIAAFPHGEPGNWQLNVIETNKYMAADSTVIPMVSVPLPATGLTPGNTYHVVVHQLNEDLNNYTQLSVGPSVNLSPYVLRARYTNGAWSAEADGWSFPITIYDNTPGGDAPLHTWQDGTGTATNLPNVSMASATYVYDWYGRLLGYCDATLQPRDPLNKNTLTGGTTTNWTPTGGTISSTTAQLHGGYSNSGLLTPDGVSTLAYASSELIQIQPGKPYTASAWFYAASSITNNVTLSVNWFDANQAYISTSSNTQSLSAATWTMFLNTYTPPSTAAYATLVPTLGGTPAAGNPLYISWIQLVKADPDVLSSVAEVTYGTNLWPPTGITQLN